MTLPRAAPLSDLVLPASDPPACFHCGLKCPDTSIAQDDHFFCCAGCRAVYEILQSNGMDRFYDLARAPGARVGPAPRAGEFDYLNDETVRRRLLSFSDGEIARATFRVPAVHCIACVWLLENLYRLKPGIGRSEVNFPRREVTLQFDEKTVTLAAVVELLASLGYTPELNLGSEGARPADHESRRLLLRLGVAGFAAGNIMMMSLASYLGLDPRTEGLLARFFGALSLLLALPVLSYSASDYWRAAWTGLRRRAVTIDLPIALGLAALFGQSVWEIVAQGREGYLDSFTGLVFLLLCGRWFQRKTYERLSFDREYTSYFPLSVLRRGAGGDAAVPVTSLAVGDRILVRHKELVPADAVLRSDEAHMDYSFVTGESAPVVRRAGDYVYAGGRLAGAAAEFEIVKGVSQSYLTSLWDSDAFRKPSGRELNRLTNAAGRYFTFAVVAVSLSVAAFWAVANPAVAVRAFTSVLLVACPCALALAAPFTLGTALRLMGRNGFYLRNTSVIEAMARLTTLVFDKTGTLTSPQSGAIRHVGPPLTPSERVAVAAVARHSTHPLSRRVGEIASGRANVEQFVEAPGRGVEGCAGGARIRLGSREWTSSPEGADDASVFVAVDGRPRGHFAMSVPFRPDAGPAVGRLSRRFALAVISGDNERDRPALEALYGPPARLLFRQSPHDKLEFVRQRQADGERVMMIGDGLNDAGALKQSDVGVAVSEDVAAFSPACDAILDARRFGQLAAFLDFARDAVAILKTGFALSLTYNVVAVGIAATGHLSPLVSAVLMPISSFSVIAFSVGAAKVAALRRGVD